MQKTTVLVVDPDEDDRDETAATIRDGPVEVAIRTADSVERAKERLDKAVIDLVVTRHSLGDGTSLELTAYIRENTPDTGVVLCAEQTELDTERYEETIVSFVPRDSPNADETLRSLIEQYGPQNKQASYPLPENEPERREAVDRYLDDATAMSASLQHVVDLAADYLGVDVASVNVVDRHTQRHLAITGADWSEGDREDSICTYTLVHDDPSMTIENVAMDPRFVDNETLQEDDIAAYLGAKIEMPDGHVIGTVCVYDDEPREFSTDERSYLEKLAAMTADIIALGADEEGPR